VFFGGGVEFDRPLDGCLYFLSRQRGIEAIVAFDTGLERGEHPPMVLRLQPADLRETLAERA
jgi:hypothetical protein